MNVFDSPLPDVSKLAEFGRLIEYVVNGSFLSDLNRMTELRNELVKRQGALTAVEQANTDRAAAAIELEAARAQAEDILDKANAALSEVISKAENLNARETEFQATMTRETALLETRKQEADDAESRVAAALRDLNAQKQDIAERQAKLNADEQSLQTRAKAFQEKVAALSV